MSRLDLETVRIGDVLRLKKTPDALPPDDAVDVEVLALGPRIVPPPDLVQARPELAAELVALLGGRAVILKGAGPCSAIRPYKCVLWGAAAGLGLIERLSAGPEKAPEEGQPDFIATVNEGPPSKRSAT